MASTDIAELAPGLACRRLATGDAAAAVTLSAAAGWNQNQADWRYMIGRGPGWLCVEPSGAAAASALTLPYGDRFAWIGMVLVGAAWQRKGIASRLLETCIEASLEQGLVPGLDATEAGRQVYLPLGFRDVYAISRWQAAAVDLRRVSDGRQRVRAVGAADMAALAARDAAVFGADRRELLDALRDRQPGFARMTEDGRGHCLGRDGRVARQLGPLVADNEAAAIALASAALAAGREGDGSAIFIDVPDHQADFRAWLEGVGFRRQRGFMRMLHGRDQPFDDPSRVFAIAGPELG